MHAHVFGAAALDHCGDAFSAFVARDIRPHRDDFTGRLQAGDRQGHRRRMTEMRAGRELVHPIDAGGLGANQQFARSRREGRHVLEAKPHLRSCTGSDPCLHASSKKGLYAADPSDRVG